MELHKRLLDNLNLAALENATETDLRTEITAIASEALEEMAIVLNREERSTLNQDSTTRSWASARWSRC